jgi:hypothetical protein
MSEDFREFKTYYSLSSKLIDDMSKEQLADCARLLALHLADYRLRFGDIPQRDFLSLLGIVEITDEQARLLREGMELLAGYLASLPEGPAEEDYVH